MLFYKYWTLWNNQLSWFVILRPLYKNTNFNISRIIIVMLSHYVVNVLKIYLDVNHPRYKFQNDSLQLKFLLHHDFVFHPLSQLIDTFDIVFSLELYLISWTITMKGGGYQSSRQARLRRHEILKSKSMSSNESNNIPLDSKNTTPSQPTTSSQPSTPLTDITNIPTPNGINFVQYLTRQKLLNN